MIMTVNDDHTENDYCKNSLKTIVMGKWNIFATLSHPSHAKVSFSGLKPLFIVNDIIGGKILT